MEMNIMFMDQKTQNCYNVISPQIDVYYSVQFQSLSPQAFLQKLTSLWSVNLGKVNETCGFRQSSLEYYMTSFVIDFGNVSLGLSLSKSCLYLHNCFQFISSKAYTV